jgi:hypothetical protein
MSKLKLIVSNDKRNLALCVIKQLLTLTIDKNHQMLLVLIITKH